MSFTGAVLEFKYNENTRDILCLQHINYDTVRPRSPRFFVPEKIRVDRNVLD